MNSATFTNRRVGFTLIELLVVISIISVLAGLLLPAINAARESGRRAECMNNLRQIGLGLVGHINARNTLPNSVTWSGYPDFASNDLNPHTVTPPGSNASVMCQPLHSWVVDVLPHMDQQQLWEDFDRSLPYYDTTIRGAVNNLTIASTGIGILTCPNDDTTESGSGNLTYVCNSGFNHYWYSLDGWDSSSDPGKERSNAAGLIDWDNFSGNNSYGRGGSQARRTGLMWPGTSQGRSPWDHKSTFASIVDGTSTTLMLAENTFGGASAGNIYTGNRLTNWASAHPNYVAYIVSDNVCTGNDPGNYAPCSVAGDLAPVPSSSGRVVDGSGWSRANGDHAESVGSGSDFGAEEGGHPFINSKHPGAFLVVMVDNSTKVVSNTIDGQVLAKLQTPAGQELQPLYKELPVDSEKIK